VFLANCERRTKALFEEDFIHRQAVRRQHANVDFGIWNCRNRRLETLAMIFDLNEIAVGGRSSEAENRAFDKSRGDR